MKRHHVDKPQERVSCEICGKVVYSIRLHMLHTHSNIRPHKCDTCGKGFAFKSILVKHVNEKHLGLKKFKALCQKCGKACQSQGDLNKHMRTHVEDRKFNCNLCEKKYKSGDGLRNHMKAIHADMRPFNCSYCTKAFHTNTILTNHLRTHTGEKPFVCQICNRGFAQKVSLRTHMKVHAIPTNMVGLKYDQILLKTEDVIND